MKKNRRYKSGKINMYEYNKLINMFQNITNNVLEIGVINEKLISIFDHRAQRIKLSRKSTSFPFY